MHTIAVILSGDPTRRELCKGISKIYSTYSLINQVFIYFEKNPAIAFNKGSKDSSSDLLFCVGGDVLVRERDIYNMENNIKGDEVIFFVSDSKPTNKEVLFCSGAFILHREKLLLNPMPETPDFMEEVLWYNMFKNKLKFKPFYGHFLHFHTHTFNHILTGRIKRYIERGKHKKTFYKRYFGFFLILITSIYDFVIEKINQEKIKHIAKQYNLKI